MPAKRAIPNLPRSHVSMILPTDSITTTVLTLLDSTISPPSAPMILSDPHFRREDRATRWRRIATHLTQHPEDLAIALENIERWLALGRVHPAPIEQWRERIHAAMRSPAALADFIAYLAADNHDTEPLKSCSPFVGLPLVSELTP